MLAHSFILSLPNQLPLPTPPPHMKCYILIIRALIQKGIKINLFITIIHLAIYSAMGEFQFENSVIIEKMQDIPALYKLNACFLQMMYLFTPPTDRALSCWFYLGVNFPAFSISVHL